MVGLVGFEPTAFEAPVECPNHFDQPRYRPLQWGKTEKRPFE